MNLLNQVTASIVLVIASAGQLPYWIHHAQCHSGDSHVRCMVLKHVHHAEQVHHAEHEQTHACSIHSHQRSKSSDNTSDALKKLSRPEVRDISIKDVPDHGHSCALCYFLSQSSTLSTIANSCEIEALVERLNSSLISQSSQDGFGVYSSRAPPAV
jgi:hypothetical protein